MFRTPSFLEVASTPARSASKGNPCWRFGLVWTFPGGVITPTSGNGGRTGEPMSFSDAHDRLAGKTAEVNRLTKRLQQLHQQIDQELQLARSIQSSFRPRV